MDTPNTIVPAPAPAATPAKADVTIPHDAFLKLIEGIHMLGAAAQKNAGVDASVPQADAADKAPEVQAPGAPGAPDAPDAASALVSILPKMSNGSQVWMSYAFAGATAAIGIAGFETHQINAQTLATLLGFGGVSVCLHQALAAIHKLIADNFGNGAADMADMVESMVEQAIAKRLGVSQ